jgi:DNA mismatch endonuclease (patch repair protein)
VEVSRESKPALGRAENSKAGEAPRLPMLHPGPSSASASARLSKHRAQDTGPELALRRELHASGLRFRVNYPIEGLPRRSIDIAFPRARVAVFMDGCFWHGCARHSRPSRSNAEWWESKIAMTRARDSSSTEALNRSGWLVLRFWEHDSVGPAANTVADAVRGRIPED